MVVRMLATTQTPPTMTTTRVMISCTNCWIVDPSTSIYPENNHQINITIAIRATDTSAHSDHPRPFNHIMLHILMLHLRCHWV